MRGVFSLCRQDFKRMLNNALFWIISVTLVLIILVVNLALPKSLKEAEYALVSLNIPSYEAFTTVVDNEDALRETVAKENGIGFIGREDGSITVIHTGLSEKRIHGLMLSLSGKAEPVKLESINESSDSVPFNKRMTPIFICFEALIVGFILGGALMLSEKQEATVKALRISPVSVNRYIISKVLLFSTIGTLYALLMAVFCVGVEFNWLQFIILSFFGSAVFSVIGLAFTTLFRDMSGWFFSASLLLSINMLTSISYSNPSFNPLWMTFIPSYPIIFAYEGILFGKGINSTALVAIGIWGVALYVVCFTMVRKMFFLKGGRLI